MASFQTNSERLALVIGNSEYENLSLVPNASNDCEDVKKKLESLGFNVKHKKNQERKELLSNLQEFDKQIKVLKKLTDGSLRDIVFYCSGHGCSIGKYKVHIHLSSDITYTGRNTKSRNSLADYILLSSRIQRYRGLSRGLIIGQWVALDIREVKYAVRETAQVFLS